MIQKIISNIKDWFDNRRKRYFITFYLGKSQSGTIQGQISIVANVGFPPRREMTRIIEENNVTNVVITNVIELSRKDYEYWTS